MATSEDFSTYTEYNPDSFRIEYITHYIRVEIYERGDRGYIYKDYGEDAITGDFKVRTHHACWNFETGEGGKGNEGGVFGIGEALDNIYDLRVSGDECICLENKALAAGTLRVAIRSTNTDEFDISSMERYQEKNYCEIERSDTILTCKIYDNSDYTSLVDTLTVNCSTNSLRYVYAFQAYHYPATNRMDVDIYKIDFLGALTAESGRSVAGIGFGDAISLQPFPPNWELEDEILLIIRRLKTRPIKILRMPNIYDNGRINI